MKEKTHFRKAFNSPYLSSADIVGPTTLTIQRVVLEPDKTSKTKDHFNTAYFVEKELRAGEPLKPMILNATNSRVVKHFANSPYIDDWNNIPVTIYVDPNVKNRGEIVEGLRIDPNPPEVKKVLVKGGQQWENAKNAYIRDGNLNKVKERVDVPQELEQLLIMEVNGNVA